ncbi:hypothetical protein ACJIZ3_014582 [Penstemon smallii]|uniref:DRBM domain-containing protein n=1 Tax=Penstemon smallii TaxID=265156 RepID=A0ABD3RKR8_9LAMI
MLHFLNVADVHCNIFFNFRYHRLSLKMEQYLITLCYIGIPEESWYKNRLQECALKASLSLPVYKTDNDGTRKPPLFRSKVWVGGLCFVSPDTFPNRKTAEQNVAKHALIGIQEKLKNEGRSRIIEDNVLCKLIVNEYAVKTSQTTPSYITNQSKAILPIFTSSLVLDGVTYIGDAARNKKEAEQFAARAAILSILDSESGSTMSEIIKTKSKLYDAIEKAKDSSTNHVVTAPVGMAPLEGTDAISSLKVKEVEVNESIVTGPSDAIPESSLVLCPPVQVALSESTLGQPSVIQATHQSFHDYKKPGTQTSEAEITLPITFVPPASQESSMCPISGKKRRKKNQKARKKMKTQSSLTTATLPNNQVHAC